MPLSAAKKLGWIVVVGFGAFIVAVSSGVAFTSGNWLFGVGLVVGALFLYWFAAERDAEDSTAATAERVADRAEGLFGGLLGGAGAFLLGIVAVAMTALDQILLVLNGLIEMTIGSPLLATTLAAIGGIFGISQWLGLESRTAGILIVVFLVSVVLLRRRIRRAAMGGDG